MSNLIRSFVFSLLAIIGTIEARSQNWEVGAFLGGSYYYGDVSNELKVQNVRYSAMLFARRHINDRFVFRANLAYFRIAGIDSVSTSEFQKARNLNFYTDIFELSGQLEYNLVQDRTRGRRVNSKVIPYVFAGLGACYFIPQTNYLGQTWNLAQLQTSGTNYSQIAIVVPIGLGVRYYLTPQWQIGAELGFRVTSTSNLDDIAGDSKYPNPADLPSDDSRLVYDRSSNVPKNPDTGIGYGYPGKQRGKVNYVPDIYIGFGLTVSYKIGIVRGTRFGGKAIRCPRFF